VEQVIYGLGGDIHQFGDLAMVQVLEVFQVNDLVLSSGKEGDDPFEFDGFFFGELFFDDDLFDREFVEEIVFFFYLEGVCDPGVAVSGFKDFVLYSPEEVVAGGEDGGGVAPSLPEADKNFLDAVFDEFFIPGEFGGIVIEGDIILFHYKCKCLVIALLQTIKPVELLGGSVFFHVQFSWDEPCCNRLLLFETVTN
jgi:hypothetical protein